MVCLRRTIIEPAVRHGFDSFSAIDCKKPPSFRRRLLARAQILRARRSRKLSGKTVLRSSSQVAHALQRAELGAVLNEPLMRRRIAIVIPRAVVARRMPVASLAQARETSADVLAYPFGTVASKPAAFVFAKSASIRAPRSASTSASTFRSTFGKRSSSSSST